MTLRRMNHTGDAMSRAEIEKAAHTFRDRLALATVKVASNLHHDALSSFKDFLPPSSSPSAVIVSASETMGRSEPEYAIGLGFNVDEQVVPDSKTHSSLIMMEQEASPKKLSRKSEEHREPSLYDAIFGPGYSRLTQKSENGKMRSKSHSRSPHVRQGSSAQLEKVASSPRPPHIPHWHQPSAPTETYYMPTSTGIHQRAEKFFAHPLSSPSKQSRRESTGGVGSPAMQPASTRNRMKSVGGSVLPNGHPASSLAQDLGLASGSTPRSRQASNSFASHTDRHWQSVNRNILEDGHDQAETDRLAAGLLRGMHERQQEDNINTTPPRSANTFADPNLVVTPRRRGARSNGEEVDAAAHSLLDLASSPSPGISGSQQHRFPGATPSLDRLVDAVDIKPRKLFADDVVELQMSPPQPNIGLQSALTLKQVDSHTPPRRRHSLYHKDLGSPPMTPPHSNSRFRKRSAFDVDYNSSSSCPNTPSRLGQLTLLSEEEEREETVKHEGRISPIRSVAFPPFDGTNAVAIETPRTPPPPPSAPTTPKAPGSNFCYGEFLHVSPSPQPRMRFNSSNGTPLLGSVQNTPTRATKSRARFASMEKDTSLFVPTSDLYSDESILTPGKYEQFGAASPRIGTIHSKRARLQH